MNTEASAPFVRTRRPLGKEGGRSSSDWMRRLGEAGAAKWERRQETRQDRTNATADRKKLSSLEKQRETALRLQKDPVWRIETLFKGTKLWSKQKEIVVSVRENRRTSVRSCHGSGKSYSAARIAASFLLVYPDSIVATTAPTDRQVKKILWQEIRRAHATMAYPSRTSPLIKEWTIRDGWFAIGLSTDDPDAFQGLHSASGYILFVIDEAAGVPKPIWEALDGSLSSEEARLLSIGNPTDPSSAFHDEQISPQVHKIHISAFDTPNFSTFNITIEDIRNNSWKEKTAGQPMPYPSLVTPIWVREKWETWGENSPMWKARVLGEFPEEADDTLIPLAWVENAKNLYEQYLEAKEDKTIDSLIPLVPVEMGVDVARYGRNETVVAVRTGNIVKVYKFWQGKDTMETVGRVLTIKREIGATSIKVDDGGVGGGVVDRLKELKEPVEAINSSGKPYDVKGRPKEAERFLNLRAQMWWNGREMLRKGELLLVGEDTLEGQLAAPKYSYDSHGRIKVESKEDMEDRGVQTPDRADAMMLCLMPSKRRQGPIAW